MQYNHKVIGIVSMDLSKAFDTLSHDLIVLKLKQYQLDDKIVNLTKGYLSNRRQRVKLGNVRCPPISRGPTPRLVFFLDT